MLLECWWKNPTSLFQSYDWEVMDASLITSTYIGINHRGKKNGKKEKKEMRNESA